MTARPTIAAPRADWMILRIHYLRVVIPLATACVGSILAFMAMALVVEKFEARGADTNQVLDLLALSLSVLVALPVGTAVFSRPFKEQHILLFQSLPVSRLRQWLLFTASSLMALLSVYAGMALLRPGTMSLLRQSELAPGFIAMTAILYAAGLCFALVSDRIVSVYMAAALAAIVAPLLVGGALLAPYFAYRPLWPHSDLLTAVIANAQSVPRVAWGIAGFAIVFLFAAASAFFYIRGEITLTRIQLRNAGIVAGALLLLTMLTSPMIYALAGGNRTYPGLPMSADGRWIAAWHTRAEAPWKSHVRVYDLATGASQSWNVDGIVDVEWNAKNELVTFVRDMSLWRRLWYLRPARDRVQRWSTRGERIGEVTIDGLIHRSWAGDPGRHYVLSRERDVSRLLELRNGASPRTLFEIPVPVGVSLGGEIIGLDFSDREPRAWRLTEGRAEELARAPVASVRSGAWVLDGAFYPDPESLGRKIEANWPVPRETGERAGYVLSRGSAWLYAVVARTGRPGKLCVMDPATKQWSLISDEIPLAPNEIPLEGRQVYDGGRASSIAFASDLAFFTERAGDRIFHYLYEPRSAQTIRVFERRADDRRIFNMGADRMAMPGTRRVYVSADLEPLTEAMWRDGRLTPLPKRPGGRLRAVWADGTQVREGQWELTVTGPNGAVLRQVQLETPSE